MNSDFQPVSETHHPKPSNAGRQTAAADRQGGERRREATIAYGVMTDGTFNLANHFVLHGIDLLKVRVRGEAVI